VNKDDKQSHHLFFYLLSLNLPLASVKILFFSQNKPCPNGATTKSKAAPWEMVHFHNPKALTGRTAWRKGPLVSMSTKWLLMATGFLETTTGIALLVIPSQVVELLLGVVLDSPPALVICRVTGSALLSIGVACLLSMRGDCRKEQRGLITGLLIYNVAVPTLLIHAAIASSIHGLALWPASGVHAALAIWCAACLTTKHSRIH